MSKEEICQTDRCGKSVFALIVVQKSRDICMCNSHGFCLHNDERPCLTSACRDDFLYACLDPIVDPTVYFISLFIYIVYKEIKK